MCDNVCMAVLRRLNIANILENKSCFLFGPRQTGKSTLISTQIPNCPVINLLDSTLLTTLSAQPARLRDLVPAQAGMVAIDEIQKLPELLNEVHLLIEERGTKFLLTGSSARSLRRKGINLLGGRARSRQLHPFSAIELGAQFSIDSALNRGLIPGIYFSDDAESDLAAYVGDYLQEEIANEGLVRSLPNFSRFLHVAAWSHTKQINYESVANESKVAASTVREFFQILRDTLIGYNVGPWGKGRRRKEVASSKFYLFDGGVARRLQQRKAVNVGSPEYGEALEGYIFHELRTYSDYERPDTEISYWRTNTQIEVDFIIDSQTAVEVKASSSIAARDLRGLSAIAEEGDFRRRILVCLEPTPREENGIEILPVQDFVRELWSGAILGA